MFLYLLPIFTAGKAFTNPDFLKSFNLTSNPAPLVYSNDESIYLAAANEGSCVIKLSNNLDLLFFFEIKDRNKYKAVGIQVSDLVYVVFNVMYLGDSIKGLVGSQYPSLNSTNGLLFVLDLTGSLVKSQWVSFCKTESLVLSYYLYRRHYLIVKDTCRPSQKCILGINGEDAICLKNDFSSLIIREDSKNNTFFALINETHTIISNNTLIPFYETSKKIQDFQINSSIYLLFDDSVQSLSFENQILSKFSFPKSTSASIYTSNLELYLSFTTRSSYLDYNSSNEPSAFLLCLSASLVPKYYRGYVSSSLKFFTKKNYLFYSVSSSSVLLSESPFSVSSIENCLDLKKNIFGQAFCYQCGQDYLLIGNSCILNVNCPEGTYKDLSSLTCSNCYNGCSGCSGPDPDSCLSCTLDYSLYQSRCLKSCPQSFYSKSNACFPCQDNCLNCTESTCFKCESFLLFNGSCVENCPYPLYNISNECVPCTQNNCKQCNESLCVCPQGTCQTCPPTCESCEDSKCSKCKKGFFLESGQCLCNASFFHNSTSGSCQKCQSNCLNCSETACFECFSPFVLTNGICKIADFNKTCPLNCESCNDSACSKCKTGFELINNTCLNCPSNCSVCVDSKCLSCESGIEVNGKCEKSCPEGFENSLGFCVKCPDNCRSCYEGRCTECFVNYDLGLEYVLKNQSCGNFECFNGFELVNNRCQKIKSSLSSFLSNLLALFFYN